MKPPRCVICDTPLKNLGAKTCSPACRTRLYRVRQQVKKRAGLLNLSDSDAKLVQQLRSAIPDAGQALNRLMTIYGREAFNEGLVIARQVGSALARKKE